jgi:hypothetical protein
VRFERGALVRGRGYRRQREDFHVLGEPTPGSADFLTVPEPGTPEPDKFPKQSSYLTYWILSASSQTQLDSPTFAARRTRNVQHYNPRTFDLVGAYQGYNQIMPGYGKGEILNIDEMKKRNASN